MPRLGVNMAAGLASNLAAAAVVSSGVDDPEAIFGSAAKFWGEDDFDVVSGAVEAYNNKLSGGGSLPQATEANQPVYLATGGPDSTPCMEIDVDQLVANSASYIAADTDYFFYLVFNQTTQDSGTMLQFGSGPRLAVFQHQMLDTSTFASLSTGASASTWHLGRGRREDDGDLAWRLDDGSESTTSVGTASYAVDLLAVGDVEFGVTPFTRVAFFLLVEGTEPSPTEDAAMSAYLASKFPSLTVP